MLQKEFPGKILRQVTRGNLEENQKNAKGNIEVVLK